MIGSGFGQNGIQATISTGSCYQSGIVKWNSSAQRFEVMGFNAEVTPITPGLLTVTMDPKIFAWIQRKMKEEEEAETHPMLKDLYEQYKSARILIKSKAESAVGSSL